MYYKYSQYVGYQAVFKTLRCLKITKSKVASKKLSKYIYIHVCVCVYVQADVVSLTKRCHLLKNNLETKCKLLTI